MLHFVLVVLPAPNIRLSPLYDALSRWFSACPGWRLAKPIFRRDAENHTRDGRAPQNEAVRCVILMRLPMSYWIPGLGPEATECFPYGKSF